MSEGDGENVLDFVFKKARVRERALCFEIVCSKMAIVVKRWRNVNIFFKIMNSFLGVAPRVNKWNI